MQKLDERTHKFSLRIIQLVNALPHSTSGQVLGRQVLRSGTSIGANIEEAFGACSKSEFLHIMTIAQRKARETHYWLRLIRDSELVPTERIESLIQEALEIRLIVAKSVVTARKRLTGNGK